MVLTGFETSHGTASLANISDQFSLFPNGVMNFVMAFQMVFFAYLMIEFIGVTTSETKNPRQVLPKAVKEIPLRIYLLLRGELSLRLWPLFLGLILILQILLCNGF